MAHGVSVITTSVSGTTEAIRQDVTGQVFSIANPSDWVAAIRRLRADPDYTGRTRVAARRWVESEFDASINSARLAAQLAVVSGRGK
jgi:glycosyltransferase involved in cell wall biosynthesis